MSGAQEPPELVEIPWAQLAPATLEARIESFVLREGTDYGEREISLDQKVARVMRQLERGEAHILFDPDTDSITIAAADRTRAAADRS